MSFAGFGALALAGAAWDSRARSRVRATAVELAAAVGLTAAVVSPYLYHAAKPGLLPVLPDRTERFSNDLLGFVVPAPTTGIGGHAFTSTTARFTAGFVEGSAYLGLPLLILVVLAVASGRRRPAVRLLGGLALVAAVLSLGARLHVGGHRSIALPWEALNQRGVTGDMLPARFSLYVVLCAAVLAAMWLAERRRRPAAWALTALAVAALWPAFGSPLWHSRPGTPALFTEAAYRHELGPRDTVLVLPIGIAGEGMLWQAEAHLRFAMAGGYIAPPEAPDPFKDEAIYPMIAFNAPFEHPEGPLRSFLASHRITAVVLDQSDSARSVWLPLLEGLGWMPREVGGTTLLRRAPPVDAGDARRSIRAVVTAYLGRLAAGDGDDACALLSPEGVDALTPAQSFDVPACRTALGRLLRTSDVAGQARASRFAGATVVGTRGTAAVAVPGRGRLSLPVRLVGRDWRIDGVTGAAAP